MKTVDEAAREYAEKHTLKVGADRTKREFAFKAGVAFAQRWVSVDEELPEDQDLVLVKTTRGGYSTAYLHGKESGFIIYGEDAYVDFGEVTHWRAIELE